MDANNPIGSDGRTYHLQTRAGDIAPNCLLVGSPERAEMIAKTFSQTRNWSAIIAVSNHLQAK